MERPPDRSQGFTQAAFSASISALLRARMQRWFLPDSPLKFAQS
jgi:hypothetical protein